MDESLNLSSTSSSIPLTPTAENRSSFLSSSSTGELITVNTTLADGLEDDVDNDQALRELLDQRQRLAAELEAIGDGDGDGNFAINGLEEDQNGETVEVDGANDSANNDFGEAMEPVNDEEEDAALFDDFDDEVDKLLEESLANRRARPTVSESAADEKFTGLSQPPAVKSKVVLKHRGMEYFEVLPDGWIEVTHSSGIPVYLHKASRVCTLARPYFIGPGSVRNHDVPISAVPCYYQLKLQELEAEREKKKRQMEADTASDAVEDADLGPPCAKKFKTPAVKVQTVEDFKNRNVDPHQLHEYCSRVFEFETINVMRFKSWSDHRAYRRRQKQQQQMNSTPDVANEKSGLPSASAATSGSVDDSASGRPSLPANVKLITVPDMEKGTKPQQKPFYMNPQGRTSIAVLHEYVQKVMKGSVSYEFSETRNAANPYCAVVRIATNDRQRGSGDGAGTSKGSSEPVWTEYGKGEGNSKKNAKLNAAKQAMRVLVPGIEFNADGIADSPQQDDAGKLFDLIKITDSRVPELSAKAGQPTPFVILQECLKRHSSFGDTTIDMNIERIKHQQHEFTMKVGKHEVKVQCTNKKEGKQRAAQAMLEKLHPQITTWGSLIRLYGYGAQRKLQETRKEKDSIIRLQTQNNRQQQQLGDEPNMAILDKLKQEMVKLYEQGKTVNQASTSKANVPTTSAVKNIDI